MSKVKAIADDEVEDGDEEADVNEAAAAGRSFAIIFLSTAPPPTMTMRSG